MTGTTSPAYIVAIAEHCAAYDAFESVREAHRNGQTSDEELSATRAVYDAARASFDVAFSVETTR
jgi:hypothetical protein